MGYTRDGGIIMLEIDVRPDPQVFHQIILDDIEPELPNGKDHWA